MEERRSTSLIKPIFFFSLEIILMVQLIGIFFFILHDSIYITPFIALYLISQSSIPRLIKILDRIVDMKLKEKSEEDINEDPIPVV